jgi:integrase
MKIRIRYGKNKREFFHVATEERAEELRRLAAQLVKAKIDQAAVLALLFEAARATEDVLAGIRAHVAASVKHPEVQTRKVVTFSQLAKEWTDGKLAERYPRHVRVKDHRLDASRLKKLCAIDVADGLKLGDVPLTAFAIDHAEAAMRGLPPKAKRPMTHRQYGQVLSRVLALAVYPCRILAANPLPKRFLPMGEKPPAFTYLYPAEDAALLACDAVPIARRLLWGFLVREGCRLGEALALRFCDLDLKNGSLTLQNSKTGESRTWALDAGVARSLTTWQELRKAEPTDAVFADCWHPADQLRDDLRAAEIARADIFQSTDRRRALRVHDLRGTFVTLSLAAGRSESWVADRTGHTTSQMINRYRRAARTAGELGLGAPLPLDQAIPTLGGHKPGHGAVAAVLPKSWESQAKQPVFQSAPLRILNSTRRFLDRPSSLSLGAIGLVWPKPSDSRRLAGMPLPCR